MNNTEFTISIIKPDANNKFKNKIIKFILNEGFNIIYLKEIHLSKELAENFYSIHKEKKFFNELIESITSGKVTILKLTRINAVNHLRTIMGNTNPLLAEVGSIRKCFGLDLSQNAIHGSDSVDNAKLEEKILNI